MTRSDLLFSPLAIGLTVLLAACGEAERGTSSGAPGALAGACLEGQTDCIDNPPLTAGEPVPIDETGVTQLRKDAKFYLGVPQDQLNETIRVGRIDDEQMALTEDYRIGRITVELDTVEKGKPPIVTSATVELPAGPETFKLKR